MKNKTKNSYPTVSNVPTVATPSALIPFEVAPVTSKFKRLTGLPTIKLGRDMKEGNVLVAKLMDVIPSRKKDIKSPLLILRAKNDQDYAFPFTRIVRSALLGGGSEALKGKEGDAQQIGDIALLKKNWVGKTLVFEYLGTRPSPTGAKDYHLLEIFVDESAVNV